MIFTECPYCDKPAIISWESGDGGSFGAHQCEECKEVMWYECTSFAGGTVTHEDFVKEKVPKADHDKVNQMRLNLIEENEDQTN